MASGSNRSAREDARMAAEASDGVRPARASTVASAASASSIACSQARSDTASRSASGTKMALKSPSEGKERGLAPALEADVEVQPVVVLHGHERLGVVDEDEDRVGRIGVGLVGEIDARDEAPQ